MGYQNLKFPYSVCRYCTCLLIYLFFSEILIKSNINHWIRCQPGRGSLVDWTSGDVTCHLVKFIASRCRNVNKIPYRLNVANLYGPVFSSASYYYYFETTTKKNWPTYDPCESNKANHLRNVENPHGSIFVR